MSEALLIQPDASFIRSVISSGGADLKKCFQCATCSAVCTLSPEDSPFPRKQMIEAQWGLKNKLVTDPALWLCHNCGDCSTRCPRGTRPGDVMGALRSQAIKHFAVPHVMGKMVANPKALLLLFLMPALIFASIALWAPGGTHTGPLEFADVFPIPVLETLFFAVAGVVAIAFAASITRFVKGLRSSGLSSSLWSGLVPALREIAIHERFRECGRERNRHWGHLLTFWGFLGLAFVGTGVGIGTMLGVMSTPLPLTSPWKIFANLCAALILAGTGVLLAERAGNPVKRATTTWFDWFFLLTITGVVVTGILSQVLRLAQAAGVMYPVYFVHLVLIFALFLYAPYSKFGHFMYRTVAIAAWKAEEKKRARVSSDAVDITAIGGS